MKDYVFLKEPLPDPVGAATIHGILRARCEKVHAVTVATHTDPWLVLVHCSEELSSEERDGIARVIEALEVGS